MSYQHKKIVPKRIIFSLVGQHRVLISGGSIFVQMFHWNIVQLTSGNIWKLLIYVFIFEYMNRGYNFQDLQVSGFKRFSRTLQKFHLCHTTSWFLNTFFCFYTVVEWLLKMIGLAVNNK